MPSLRRWVDAHKRQVRTVTRRNEISAWLDRVNQMDPCDNPDCNVARQEMRDILDGSRRRQQTA